ncbi:hypothetical protein [Patulibacter defluvii]|uniref:hypothetical protein n=1 Tax=Patulibacter defluvii TaxID=3095358 RepID=UPI002A7598C7|nr:hypothetical protein [Patulibacter sp. DM4]
MALPTRTMRYVVAALVAAALAAGAVVLPASSTAAPTPAQRLNVIPDPWLGPVLDDLGQGRPLGRLLKDVLCPPVGEVDELVSGVPGLQDLTGILETGACNLDVLDYSYHTEFRRPDGSLAVKNVPAIVNVPTFLDVDDKPGAEFVATIRVLGIDQMVVQIDRVGPLLADGVLKPLPASVEAIIADPSKGSLPRKRIAYGFDAKESSAPTQWETVLRLTDVFGSPDPLKLGVDFNQTGATGPVAVTGEIYNPDASRLGRRDRMGGAVRFQQPPARASVDFELGSRVVAHLRTTTSTKVDVLARLQENDDETRIEASIDQLPRQVDIAFSQPGPDQMRIDYDAISPIAALDARYTKRKGAPEYDTVTTTAEAHVRDLPQGLTVEQTGPEDFRFSTRGGKIGAIEAAFAQNGAPITESEPGDYVKVVQDGSYTSLAARLLGLERARFSGASPMTIEATVQPGPVRASVHTPDLDAEATIRDLPHELRLILDLEKPRIVYDGDGSGIDEINVRAQSAKPLFGRATHLDATVKGIPATMQLDLKQSGDDVEFVTDNPIGSIQLLASDGHAESLPAGQQGVIYRDQEDRWLIFGRIFGLRQVKLRTEPLKVLVRAGEGKPFSADATVRQPGDDLDVHASIENLPRRVEVGLTQDQAAGTSIVYDADQPIGRIVLEGQNLELLDRADDFRVAVNDVPAHFEAKLPESGALVEASAIDPIGEIKIQLADGGFEELPPGRDGAIYLDTDTRFAITAKVSHLRGLKVVTDPLPEISLDLPDAPNPFDFKIERRKFPDEPIEYFRGTIDRPQRDTKIKLETDPQVRLDYGAGGAIDTIALESNVGSLGLIDATLQNLPRALKVCFDSGPGCKRPESPDDDALVSAAIDDDDASHGPIVLNGLICMSPDSDVDCRNPSLRKTFVTFENLSVREFAFDAVSDGISSGAFIDTDNKDLTGKVEYRDTDLPIIDGFRIALPSGFRAQNRQAGIFSSAGTIVCPSGTTIGTISPDINLAGLLCP